MALINRFRCNNNNKNLHGIGRDDRSIMSYAVHTFNETNGKTRLYGLTL